MAEFTDFEIDVNLTEQQAWGGEKQPLVKPGDYRLLVEDVKSSNAKSTNNPMITVTFMIEAVADGNDDNADQVGAKVWQNYVLTDKAMGRVTSLMIACGAPLDKIRSSALRGCSILATVFHSDGAATADAAGNVREAKTFANVMNERAIEVAETNKTAAAPVARGSTPAPAAPKTAAPAPKNGSGAVRRA
jgi:hypothetical protein